MSRERKLLERIVTAWEDDRFELIDAMYPIIDDVRKLLESEKQDQPEPVAWLSPTSKTFSTVETSHHTAPLFLHPEAKNPSEMESSKEKILELAHRWCSRYRHGDEFPYLFNEYHLLQFVQRLHPAPRRPFVRLSDEEIETIHSDMYDATTGQWAGMDYFARAIEDALEEKNK